MTEERYLAVRDVEHTCCHTGMVIDNTKAEFDDDFVVCECPDYSMAIRIAELLNSKTEKTS